MHKKLTSEKLIYDDRRLSTARGFTLLEILISVMILTIGIMAVSQLTITSEQANRIIKQLMEGREVLARGMEVLKLLPHDDIDLSRTGDSLQLDSITPLAHHADTNNLVGKTIGATVYEVYWNVADSFPSLNYKTIRMFVLNKEGKRLMDADFVKWEQ